MLAVSSSRPLVKFGIAAFLAPSKNIDSDAIKALPMITSSAERKAPAAT